MRKQTEYKSKLIRGYGCAVCSVINVCLEAAGTYDFSDEQMNTLLEKAYESGVLKGNCYIMSWGILGQYVLEILGINSTVSLVLFKRAGEDHLKVYSDKPVNGIILQYIQTGNSNWSHFTGTGYNPDPTLSIAANPTGIRGLNIDLEG